MELFGKNITKCKINYKSLNKINVVSKNKRNLPNYDNYNKEIIITSWKGIVRQKLKYNTISDIICNNLNQEFKDCCNINLDLNSNEFEKLSKFLGIY